MCRAMNNVLADGYGFTEIIFLVIAVNRGLVPLPLAPTPRNHILTMGAQFLLFKLLWLFPRIQSNYEKTKCVLFIEFGFFRPEGK